MMSIEPHRAVAPILRIDRTGRVLELLGTGFFVGQGSSVSVVTAHHVFRDNQLVEDQQYALAFCEAEKTRVITIPGVTAAKEFDIAVFDGSGFPEAVRLPIGDYGAPFNADVFSFEYSSTRFERLEDGSRRVIFEPHAHKGNIVQYYESDSPEARPTSVFLTSFPALQGASGAPVITGWRSNRFAVVGMLLANVERHLVPAQILRIDDGGNLIEETRYY